MLSPAQKALQADLIALCETTLRPNAIESDKGYVYPRKNFEALAAMGLMSLTIPKELGGRGENHLCAAMVVETIARYGCPSTAMCYTMHLGACAAALLRHHDNERLKDILRRVDKDVLIGTLSYSDPETGSHFWYPMSSRAERTDGGWKVFKKASWTTSGGFADWYIIQTTSPDFGGDYSNLSCFLVTKDQIKADPANWDGLGMRGNQSGPISVDGVEIAPDALVGPVGDGAKSNDEVVDPFFLVCSSACWNGICRTTATTCVSSACRCGAPRPCALAATIWLRLWPYSVCVRCGRPAVSASNASRCCRLSNSVVRGWT